MAVWVSPVVQGNNAYTSVCAHVVVSADTKLSSGLISGQDPSLVREPRESDKGG